MYGLIDQGTGITFNRKLLYVNNDMGPALGRKLQRPALNEFLSFRIEILVKKKRWVYRIEQLGEVVQMKFDPMNRYGCGLHDKKGFNPSIRLCQHNMLIEHPVRGQRKYLAIDPGACYNCKSSDLG